MQTNLSTHSLNKKIQPRSGAALYILVVTMSVLISMIGLTGMNLMRLQRDQMLTGVEMQRARLLSRSAVELAFDKVKNDSNWRTTYTSGLETTALNLNANMSGTISWILQDSDGSLSNGDINLKLLGIGRINNTVQVSSIDLSAELEVGPQEFRSYTSLISSNSKTILDTHHAGQYFKVTLPAEATSWKVTEVDLYLERDIINEKFNIRIAQANASELPTATTYDITEVSSNDVPFSASWMTIPFSGNPRISPSQGVCLMLEHDRMIAPTLYYYKQGGVSQTNSAYISGPPGGLTNSSNSSILYRVRGVYYIGSVTPSAVAGTWQWSAIP